MTTYLYSIAEDTDGRYTIRKWEVIRTTKEFYIVQPRDISNKRAQTIEKRIKREEAEPILSYLNIYHLTPNVATEAFVMRQQERIRKAEVQIKNAKEAIARIEKET